MAASRELVVLFLVVLAALATTQTAKPQERVPGSAAWKQVVDERLDDARRYRMAGQYDKAVAALWVAAAEARSARPSSPEHNDQLYVRNTQREAQQLVAALASDLEQAVHELERQSLLQREAWRTDPTLKRAIEDTEALQSAPERADKAMRELEETLRVYLRELTGQPILRDCGRERIGELGTIVVKSGRVVDSVCHATSLGEARNLMDYAVALYFYDPVEECRLAASQWKRLTARDGTDVELGGVRPSSLRRLVDGLEQRATAWRADLARLDAGVIQRIEEAHRAATDLLRDLGKRLRYIEYDLGGPYRSAREVLIELDSDAATNKPTLSSWTDRAINEIEILRDGTVWLEGLLNRARSDRTVLRAVPNWIETLKGPEMLGRIDRLIAEANEAAAKLQIQMRRLDDEIERGRRCLATLAGYPVGQTAPVDGSRPPKSSENPPATPTPTIPSLAMPPPTPTPTPATTSGAAPAAVDPDVAGGLKINGPRRIGVGWRVSYSATDHGGRPVSDVSWHAMADTIRVEDEGTVVGLRPGRATVMATAHGMRAFFDFEVLVDDGAPATPGGSPALARPRPDVIVVPPTQPTSTPTSASPPPSDDRTTDWAAPTPTPWFVPDEADSGTGDERVPAGGRDQGGGFEDLDTEIVPGSGSSPPPSGEGGTPSIPIGPAGAAVAGATGLPRPPSAPPSGGGFEDLDTEVVPADAEPEPPQPQVADEEPGDPTDSEVAQPAADDGTAESSEPAEGLTFLGETAGPAAAPTTDRPMVLLPPPGEGSPGSEGAPPSGGTPPGGFSPPTPDDDWPPFVPSRASVNGAGQPAAYHIFATCSRLAWAGALATYSVGPADAAIADHLLVAGEHAMWANRTSFPPLPAWPDWQARRGLWGDWAARLARTRDSVFRGQMAHFLSTGHETLAQDLDVRMIGGAITRTPTCEAEYCRLGFLMAWGQQALAIAEEADRNGNAQVVEAASVDGVKRLRLARGRLPGYERIAPPTGPCADFTPIGGLLDGAIGGGGSIAARAAWETALAAVMALSPGQPPPSDGSLLGGWVLADGRLVTVTQQGDSLVGMADNRELFRVRPKGGGSYSGQGLITTRSGDSEQSRWYDGLTVSVEGDTATGTIGQLGFTMTRAGESPVDAPIPATPDSTPPAQQCPIIHFNGEIQGDWAWGECCPLRFTSDGSEWIGAFTRLNDAMMEIGHRVGQPWMRLRSTGPLTYEGTTYTHWNSSPVIPVDTTVIVAGSSLIRKEGRLFSSGLTRRSHADTSGRLHDTGFWIGCARKQPDTLDCSIDSDPHPDAKRSTASGADRLRMDGYPIIVLGPVTGYEAVSWIFEHHDRRFCFDSTSTSSTVRGSQPATATGPPPSSESSDLQMMGVEVSEDDGDPTR